MSNASTKEYDKVTHFVVRFFFTDARFCNKGSAIALDLVSCLHSITYLSNLGRFRLLLRSDSRFLS